MTAKKKAPRTGRARARKTGILFISSDGGRSFSMPLWKVEIREGGKWKPPVKCSPKELLEIRDRLRKKTEEPS